MAKICLISDTHRKHRDLTIPACDLLIHSGDFCSFEQDDHQTLLDVDQWFQEVPAKQVICVGGNHDVLLESGEFRFAHATLLHDSGLEVEGLSLYGSPWCPNLPGFAYFADDDGLKEAWRKIPSGIDLLITHTPPFGILDLPTSQAQHLGCPLLREELTRIQPKLHLFGHIHASHGTHHEGQTHFVNASVVGGPHLELRHPPICMEPSTGWS
ncbi:MAG: metallophosphatase domain-containing protein [Verrucomicrobiota bacterium]